MSFTYHLPAWPSRLLLTGWLGTACMTAQADRYTEMAQKHLEWLQAGTADSVLVHCTPQVKAQLPATMLQAIWKQLEAQAGPLQRQEPWTVSERASYKVCQSVLRFERTPLQLNVVLDEQLLLAGLNFTPAPPQSEPAATPATADSTYVEQPLTVKLPGIELPGTLTLPRISSSAKLPAVVLVHGSGPNDRDETLGPNKPFAELAHSLAQRGIAVLRYDKRTRVYGAQTATVSGGVLNYDTEVVDDAVQAVRQLAQLPQVDASRVYVLGHSLGGILVPRIAEQSATPLAGIIGCAALARPFEEALHDQLVYIARSQGAEAAVAETQADSVTRRMISQLPDGYADFQRQYSATATAARLGQLPMLFLQGGHDYQVTEADLNLWKQELAHNRHARFCFFPKLDHLLRELPEMAKPADYMQPGSIHPEALQQIADFILHTP